jgi:hypothetical protein
MVKAFLGCRFGITRVALVSGVVLAGFIQSAHAAVNLLTDGSFDDDQGNIPSHNVKPANQGGWLWAGTAGIDAGNPYGSGATNCVAYNSNPITGTSQMAFIEGAGAGGGLSVAAQTISLIPGQLYEVDFEAKAIAGFSGVDPIYVTIFNNSLPATPLFGGAALSPSTAGPDTNGYTHYSADFVAINTTEQLDIYDAGNQSSATVTWVDAASVTAVPEPASMALVSAVALPLLGRRRRITARL